MALVTSGLMNKQVAAKTGLAESTVKSHRGQVMRKMGAKSLADLIKMAEIIDVHGNSFRHRPSSELEVASDACASDPRFGKTAHGSIGDFATPDARHAVLAGQVLKQQPDKIKFRRLSLVGSRAGQAIEDTRTARAGQSRQSISRQFPAVAYIPRGGRSHAKRRPWKLVPLSRALVPRRRFLRTRL